MRVRVHGGEAPYVLRVLEAAELVHLVRSVVMQDDGVRWLSPSTASSDLLSKGQKAVSSFSDHGELDVWAVDSYRCGGGGGHDLGFS